MKRKYKVVMLPTNQKAPLGFIGDSCLFMIKPHKQEKDIFGIPKINYQHLYFISDDEIQVGDWVYSEKGTPIVQHHTNNVPQDNRNYGWRKIIATTDTSLNLPKPSIDEVLVEYSYKGEQKFMKMILVIG